MAEGAMSSSEDSCYFEEYVPEEDATFRCRTKKKSRLIAAVVHNDIEVFKELLSSPKWYNVRDKYGYTLLQIAIIRDSKEVFDYMLSLEDFPIDAGNKSYKTSLEVSLIDCHDFSVYYDMEIEDYYACQLLQRDVKVVTACEDETICDIDSTVLINRLLGDKVPLSLMSEIVCYFLSYGMTIKVEDFHRVYKKFGFGELFKILLHMDVNDSSVENAEIIPALFYDVKICNIEAYLQDRYKFSTKSGVEELLSYSSHPKLKEFCHTLDQKSLIAKAKNLPDVPLLVEFARDVFREYFIKKFNVTTCKQFYMMLKLLPVSEIHRKIITFETKLYS